MIRFKNGQEIQYREDFDAYFHDLIMGIIKTSLKSASFLMERGDDEKAFNDKLIREIMDNCIYITKQIQDMGKTNPNLQTLLITASLFNCAITSLSRLGSLSDDGERGESFSGKELH